MTHQLRTTDLEHTGVESDMDHFDGNLFYVSVKRMLDLTKNLWSEQVNMMDQNNSALISMRIK